MGWLGSPCDDDGSQVNQLWVPTRTLSVSVSRKFLNFSKKDNGSGIWLVGGLPGQDWAGCLLTFPLRVVFPPFHSGWCSPSPLGGEKER